MTFPPDARRTGPGGHLVLRDVLLLAFFCRVPAETLAPGVHAALTAWLDLIPDGVLAWARVGASATEPKPFTASTLARCETLLAAPRKRETTAFDLGGPERVNPAYRFGAVCDRDPEPDLPWTSLVEMRFAPDALASIGTERFVDWACSVAAALPYDSGYASLALTPGADSDRIAAGAEIPGLALRHPGYDVAGNDRTRFTVGTQSRGARWLTFLGDEAVVELGGRDTLAEALDGGVEVREAGSGLALRASDAPHVGDTNRESALPLLRSVAQAIEPVTLFGDDSLETLFRDDEDVLKAWERRFFA